MPNRRITVGEAALLLMPAAGYFALAAKLPSVPIVTGIILLLSLGLWRALPVNDRTITYFSVASGMLAILLENAFPIPDGRFSFLAMLLHPELYVPFLLYLAAFSTALRRPHLTLGASLAAALAALACCGEQQIFYDTAFFRPDQRQDLLAAFRMRAGYWALIVLESLMFFWLLRSHYRVGRTRGRRVAAFVSAALVFAAAWGFYQSRLHCEEALRQLENMLLRSGDMKPWRQGRPFIFDAETLNINATLSPEMFRQESEIVFHVTGKLPPGYLRGRGYSRYDYGGEWQVSKDYDTELESREGAGMIQERTFFLRRSSQEPPVRWTVLPVGRHQKAVVYYPGGASEIRMLAGKAMLSPDGTLTAKDSTLTAGYTILADSNRDSGAPVRDDPEKSAGLRQIPADLVPVLREIRYVTETLTPQPDAEYFRRILNFFRDNFRYSLTSEPAPTDPVEHFLLNTRRGHCELFASAMTLLLRSGGIPARYVTGFICEEPHRSGRSFVARMGNAHAWVEAYDRDRKEWVLLEPTPAVPPLPPRRYEAMLQWWETARLCIDEFVSLLRRGHVTEAAASLAGGAFSLIAQIFGHWLTWLLLGGAALTGGVMLWRKGRRHDRFAPAADRKKLIRQYRLFLLKMQLSGRGGLFPAPTALEMEKELKKAPLARPEKQAAALAFLREYRARRYRAD